jgi:oligopeptide/dipeptide ABC transporter ATP-binding protein
VQAQVLNLLLELQERLNLTYLVISHDLGVISYVCDRVAVMYSGRIMEMASAKEIFQQPCHPYTHMLLTAMPELGEARPKQSIPLGMVQGGLLGSREDGCRFAPRCPVRLVECVTEPPALVDVGNGHLVACHRCVAE